MRNISIFASGSGSNLQSIIDHIATGKLQARISFVLSNNSAAFALTRARNHNIPAIHFSSRQYGSAEAYADALLNLHRDHAVEFILLAGYMKLLPTSFIKTYQGKIVNIHPALLPKYGGQGMYGMHVHEAVVRAGEKESGATVHFVTEKYDEGPIILQEKLALQPGETPETLSKRILEVEHRLYPKAVAMILEGKVPF